jgi:hypothetical protein
LVQELEEEYGLQDMLSPDIEEPLRDLQADSIDKRIAAVERLGRLDESSLETVKALVVARETDYRYAVVKSAKEALRAPVHQE